ncbi:MAG TPA: hypothetical protein PKA33_21025 [Amaricoccus sp.]|uniref:hypothetical protein n=1 Tax=Amaricoccus sp. TaxID=1872485 RepID=UPI002BB18201|nr:hypothetical protein [Amaricoccus sp.]HMQ94850.1 hypothetical protein [Amaricoccus sp.]HMR54795.1 hypothetical protein [Amaricoccus sp.]HMR61810.1 hypothetical protein [Amaricoccus sp.]HMU01813.1 hypothetical protein [Amaricoccus sp.]
MSQISELENRFTVALNRLRAGIEDRPKPAAAPADASLARRVEELEKERVALNAELERLREKRDRDVAHLDELIAQLKPLIEEV